MSTLAASNYDIGDLVRLSATFTSTAGALADPTKVTFVVNDPSGNSSTTTSASTGVVHPSTGLYTLDVDVDEAGVWQYRVNSTGVVTTAGEAYFRARHSRV